MKYVVVTASSAPKLSEDVTKLLQTGQWKLTGNLQVVMIASGSQTLQYTQALVSGVTMNVRPEKETKDVSEPV